MSMNAVHVLGNLTRDIELVYAQSGTPIANIGLAVNNRTKRGEEWVDEPCFLDVTYFGKHAEWCAGNLAKGSQVGVDGKLVMDQWEDKNTGQKRSKIKILAQKVHLTGSRQQNQQGPPAHNNQYAQPAPVNRGFAGQVADAFGGAVESDVPF